MNKKPSEKEEEYFGRMEFERNKKLEEEKHKKFMEGEKTKGPPIYEITKVRDGTHRDQIPRDQGRQVLDMSRDMAGC